MNAPNQAPGPGQKANFGVGGSTFVPLQPDEPGFPLRRDQFELLCEGEPISQEKANRDICIAVAVSAGVGVIGLLATVDWKVAINQTKMWPFVWMGVLGISTVSAIVVAALAHYRCRHMQRDSGYSRTKARINQFYESQHGEEK